MLDIPAGTGRLTPALARTGARTVAADRSPTMLAEVEGAARLLADVRRLPFPGGAFDATVCCRLLHHLEPDQRRAAISELVRVTRELVIVSFWDAGSLHAWRRRTGLRRASHPDSRRAVPREAIRADLEAAGARVLGWAASFRFVSPQTFVAARVDGR